MCFTNSIFGYTKKIINFLYCCLFILFCGSFIIIMQIISGANIEIIIISEIIWELAIEIMCIYLLFLFVSKLHCLVKMALGSNRRNLRMTISYNISEKSKIHQNHSRSNSRRTSKIFSRTSIAESPRSGKGQRAKSPSPSPSPSPVPPPIPRKKSKPNQTVLNNQNLVNVMTKMTLLVVVAVIGSILSIIGNIYIEIHELKTIKEHTANVHSMWAYLLPVIDMVLASFMLYLQFDFTKQTYSILCTKMDILFIQFCGDLLDKEVTNQQNKEESINKIKSKSKTSKTSKNKSSKSPKSPKNNNTKKLTLDITNLSDGDSVFRPPSPSPSPLAESPRDIVNDAIKNNDAIEIKGGRRKNRLTLDLINKFNNNSSPTPITPRSPTPTTPKSPSPSPSGGKRWRYK